MKMRLYWKKDIVKNIRLATLTQYIITNTSFIIGQLFEVGVTDSCYHHNNQMGGKEKQEKKRR